MIASTQAILGAVRRQSGLAYADDTWSPISDITVQLLAKNMGAALVERSLPEGIQEMGVPAIFGPPLVAVNRDELPGLRRLALRHGLAHLVAGELDAELDAQIRFMSSIYDWTTLEERRADLFALADLIPDRMLEELRAAAYSAEEMARWVYCEIARYAPAWPPERIRDRAHLRLSLAGAE